MAIAFVQESNVGLSGAGPFGMTIASAADGNTLVACIYNTVAVGGSTPSVVSLACTNVTWTLAKYQSHPSIFSAHEIWYGRVAGGASGTTLTITMSVGNRVACNVSEWSGILAAGDPLDGTSGNTGSSGTTQTITGTTTEAGLLIVAEGHKTNVATSSQPASPYTTLTAPTTVTGKCNPSYLLPSSAGSESATWTTGSAVDWITVMAGFKAEPEPEAPLVAQSYTSFPGSQSGGTLHCELEQETTPGSLLVLTVGYVASPADDFVIGVTDSEGNTWTKAIYNAGADVPYPTQIWYAKDIEGGTLNDVAIELASGTMDYVRVWIHEFNGYADLLDTVSAGGGSGTINSGTITVDQPALMYGVGVSNNGTAGNHRGDLTPLSTNNAEGDVYKLIDAGTDSVEFTDDSSQWVCLAVAFAVKDEGSTTLSQDSFTDADSTELMSHTPDIGSGWTVNYDPEYYTIQGNALSRTNNTNDVAWVEVGQADMEASANFTTIENLVAVLIRVVDGANYWEVYYDWGNSGWQLNKVVSGVDIPIGPTLAGFTGTVTLKAVGNTITAISPDGDEYSTTDAALNTATKAGLLLNGFMGSPSVVDDWLVEGVSGEEVPSPLWFGWMNCPVAM